VKNKLTYEGGFKKGQKEGLGTETYNDGTQYIGNFHEGKWSGEGIVTYKDGR